MTIILVLLPLTLVLVALAVWAFFWAVGDGQFDDLDSPAYRILLDDDDAPRNGERRDEGEPPADTTDAAETTDTDVER